MNEQPKKSIFKRWWFWVSILTIIVIISGYVLSSESRNKKIQTEKQKRKKLAKLNLSGRALRQNTLLTFPLTSLK